jgi:transcriptional regulator with XRE-family HTH domain
VARRPRNESLNRAFGDRLRELRAASGLSQERLAGMAGMHTTYVGRLERGTIAPTLDTIVRLASALDLDPARLVCGLQGHLRPPA